MARDEGHVQISARIPLEMAEALERSAREADRSFSAELRRAIRRYLIDVPEQAGGRLTATG